MENIYKENGYTDRTDYLNSLSEDYGVSSYEIECLADILGEPEDFDGLVSALEDYEYFM